MKKMLLILSISILVGLGSCMEDPPLPYRVRAFHSPISPLSHVIFLPLIIHEPVPEAVPVIGTARATIPPWVWLTPESTDWQRDEGKPHW